MTTNQEVAQSLIIRAMQSTKASEMDLLLGAAARLDNTIDYNAIKKAWIEQWLTENKEAKTQPRDNVGFMA